MVSRIFITRSAPVKLSRLRIHWVRRDVVSSASKVAHLDETQTRRPILKRIIRETNPGLDILCVHDARVSSHHFGQQTQDKTSYMCETHVSVHTTSGNKPRTRLPHGASHTFSSELVLDACVSSHIRARNPRLNYLKVQVTRLPLNKGLGQD